MANRKYNRVFVLMTGKNAGQSLNGSCDMEVINGKGRLYAYVGKLNKLTYTPRKLYLISVGLAGSMAVPAGNLAAKGRNSSIEAEFDPDNLFGSGIAFEEINVIAVWGENDGPNNAVLEGFVSKRLNWHSNLEIFGGTKSVKPLHTEKVKIVTAEPETDKENSAVKIGDNEIKSTDSVIRSTDPVIRSTDPVIKSTDPVIKSTDSVIRSTDSVIRSIDPVIRSIDPVIRSIDPVIKRTEELYKKAVFEPEPVEEVTEELSIAEKINEDSEPIKEDEVQETGNEPEETETPELAVTEEVEEKVKEDVSELSEKLSENINEADKLTSIAAAESISDISPHDTFRAIAQKFRRELDMLDEMGIIDKTMFFDDKVDTKETKKEAPVPKAEAISKPQPVPMAKPIAKEEPQKAVAPDSPTAKAVNAAVSEVKTRKITPLEEGKKAEKVNHTAKVPLSRNEPMPQRSEAAPQKIAVEKKAEPLDQSKTAFAEMTPMDRLFLTNDKLSTDDGKEWVKIDYREAYFVEEAIKDIRCFFVRNAARKGKHMIIGRTGRDIFIGVPGEKGDRKYAEKNGFNDFLTVNSSLTAGYWVKAI